MPRRILPFAAAPISVNLAAKGSPEDFPLGGRFRFRAAIPCPYIRPAESAITFPKLRRVHCIGRSLARAVRGGLRTSRPPLRRLAGVVPRSFVDRAPRLQ